ncbi:MAG: carboxypeptidase-like regulatory domain-containing protein [Gemmatimonadota bacterium]
MRIHHALILVMTLVGMGCYDGLGQDPIICTDIFVYGLNVDVVDAATSAPLAEGATLTVIEGTYVETVTASWDGRSMAAAGERPGTYSVRVERVGYRSWERSDVQISSDECHVIPRSLEARLVPTP